MGTNNLFAPGNFHSQRFHVHHEPISCARFHGAFRFSFPVPERAGIPSLHIALHHLRLLGDFRYEGISYRKYLIHGQDNPLHSLGVDRKRYYFLPAMASLRQRWNKEVG